MHTSGFHKCTIEVYKDKVIKSPYLHLVYALRTIATTTENQIDMSDRKATLKSNVIHRTGKTSRTKCHVMSIRRYWIGSHCVNP